MKKVIALVLAAVMMMTVVSAFAATYATTPTAKVEITGLENGDTVNLYRVIGWDTGSDNWVPYNNFSGIANINNFSEMDYTKAAAIAAAVKVGDKVETVKVSGDTYTSTNALPVGMYIAIVESAGNAIYNPMILSVNYNYDNGQPLSADSSTVNASSTDFIGSSSVAKKSEVLLDKSVDGTKTDDDDKAKTVEVGDTVPFIVTTTLPIYSESWDSNKLEFVITDQLSKGLTLNQDSLKVVVEGDTADGWTATTADKVTITKGTDNYKVEFAAALLKEVRTNKNVTITYTATVGDDAIATNVDVMTNDVKLEYSNNPNDYDSHAKKEVQTHHYTFSIDANIDGDYHGQSSTSELIKVGVKNGESVYAWRTVGTSEWSGSTKLADATFTLTKTSDTTDGHTYSANYITKADGKIKFEGLEEGTYELVETSAPDGYIRDTKTHTVVIEAKYKDDYTDASGVVHKHELKSYTITIDGAATSTYYTTNAASDSVNTTSVLESSNTTFPIANTEGLELPSTGGIGTTLFYIFGGVMMLAAGIILVARRKAEE